MRAGLSTIQQTLTPEAATVLNHSIAEASRRNHGQTTPLHVAATLLSSPSGFLRQACASEEGVSRAATATFVGCEGRVGTADYFDFG
ncbi:hypothetical protein T459_18737 [Capsicum annuum]|uniref:Clp R domain-containing protein n=1 Tax=Capsicum annuum TaxID=4072 RepID=A0A2G2Z026_CAPAN|nr:hypothetical protein T459_18737 [Capsicum annuum]